MKNTQDQLKKILEDLDRKALPHTYSNIGKELGISRQRAHQVFFEFMPPKPTPLQDLILELMHKDISEMSPKEVFVQFGKKHQLSYCQVYNVLRKNGFNYFATNYKEELAEIVAGLGNASVPEILRKINPKQIKRHTAKQYLYNSEYRSRFSLEVKPMRPTFRK